ncbi:MAG: glycosyltransferase [Candidatus Aminicenantia bacterium]
MRKIEDYIPIVGKSDIEELYILSEKLKGRSIQNINSTSVGGGVAEILRRMIPLLRDLGVNVWWDVIKGDDRFFNITKKLHNSLHGVDVKISREELEYFLQVNEENSAEISSYGDIVFIHDPQPVAIVEKKKEIGRKWIWRCHIDFTTPKPETWEFIKGFVEKYDCAVFSAPSFSREISIRQVLISPSIDPLSEKNKEISEAQIDEVCERFGIERKRPIITQISRFDYLKDPIGVIKAYRLVKEHIDCQLVLAGGGATDDPEGMKVLEDVKNEAEGDLDIHVLFLPPGSDIEINALQRASTVILQKSLREGFGLTVAEALWKAKPVVASAVGGIPLQITHKYSGILTHSIEGTAFWIKQLINEPQFANRLSVNGREHIRNNFLITRHLRDYLLLFLSMVKEDSIIYL